MTKVGVFPRDKIHHYRKEIFKLLKKNELFDIEFYVSTNEFSDDFPTKFINTYTFNFCGKTFKFQPDLKKIVKRDNLDIIIISFSPYYISNLLLLFDKERDYKIVAFTHGYFKNSKLDSFKNKFLKFILKNVDAVLFYTEDIAEHYIQSGFNENKIFFIDNTLDTNNIEKTKSLISENQLKKIKNKYNINNRKVVIFVGRFIKSKRPMILLKALEYHKRQYGTTPFLFMVGSGPLEGKIKRYIDQHLKNDVSLVGKIIDEEKIAPFFLNADIFIMPGKTGLSINHAFSYQLPYITTSDNIPAPEIILLKEGINGEYFQDKDFENLAEKIHDLIFDDCKLEEYSKNAYEKIKNRYNINNMKMKFIDMLNKLSNE